MYEGTDDDQQASQGELEPGLAESWQISPDQRRITYKLGEGLKWSDGEPITVDDILFTYNEIVFNEKIPTSVADVFRVGEQGLFPTVRKVDERQVEFEAPRAVRAVAAVCGRRVSAQTCAGTIGKGTRRERQSAVSLDLGH